MFCGYKPEMRKRLSIVLSSLHTPTMGRPLASAAELSHRTTALFCVKAAASVHDLA
ncbi:MAG: hypothetical protein RLZZ50_1401 [Verrucomicrobiota bacterium]|jgi:hypothetical protein